MSSFENILLNLLWQSLLISIIGWLLLKFCNQISAPKRSTLASSFLFAIILLPILSSSFIILNIKPQKFIKLNSPETSISTKRQTIAETKSSDIKVSPTIPYKQTGAEKIAPVEFEKPFFNELFFHKLTIFLASVWGAGMLFMYSKILSGLLFINGFRYGLKKVDDEKISTVMSQACSLLQLKYIPGVFISSKIESPITAGITKPAMIIPEKLYTFLNTNEINSIVLHELSHIKHRDHIMGLVKRIIIATNWWNPLVYIISAEHSIAREDVCDNYVLSKLKPEEYSECLIDLAEKTCLISCLPATVGMADKFVELEQRVKNILSPKRKRDMNTRRGIKTTIIISTLTSALVIGCFSYTFAENKKAGEGLTSKNETQLYLKGTKLTPEQAKELEEKVKKNPDDLKLVAKLLGYYGRPSIWSKDYRLKKKKLVLYLINNHPETILFSSSPSTYIDNRYVGYKDVIEAWQKQLKKNPENLTIIWNAAKNLIWLDKKLREKCFKKGQKLDPENPKWSKALGFMYYLNKQYDKSYIEYKKALPVTKVKSLSGILAPLGKAAYLCNKDKEAGKYADQMIKIGKETKSRWSKGEALYNGYNLKGLLAFNKGNLKVASENLIMSAKAVESVKAGYFFVDYSLASQLYFKNQKKAVIKFLEICSKYPAVQKAGQFLADIRKDITPNFNFGSLFFLKNRSNLRKQVEISRTADLIRSGKSLSQTKAKELEKTLYRPRPFSDKKLLNTQKATQLLGYYWKNQKEEKRKDLIYQMIEYGSCRYILLSPEAQIKYPPKDDKLISIWKNKINKKDVSIYTLRLGARLLIAQDPKLALQCAEKGKKLRPDFKDWDEIIEIIKKQK